MRPTIDLDPDVDARLRALAGELAGEIEDDETVRKLELRK